MTPVLARRHLRELLTLSFMGAENGGGDFGIYAKNAYGGSSGNNIGHLTHHGVVHCPYCSVSEGVGRRIHQHLETE